VRCRQETEKRTEKNRERKIEEMGDNLKSFTSFTMVRCFFNTRLDCLRLSYLHFYAYIIVVYFGEISVNDGLSRVKKKAFSCTRNGENSHTAGDACVLETWLRNFFASRRNT